jgi:hypothetical protein
LPRMRIQTARQLLVISETAAFYKKNNYTKRFNLNQTPRQ